MGPIINEANSTVNEKNYLKKVKRDYSKIAVEFNATREDPWPEFKLFKKYLKKTNIKVLDAGCGNGRLAQFLKNESVDYVGVDNNKEFLKIAKKNNPKVLFKYGDVLELPFSASSFDSVWCIAVLHHLPTKILQLKALREMRRVLKKNGSLMLTVWNLWQPKYEKYIDKKNHEALVPWGVDKKVKRFYYAFKEKELISLLKLAGFSKLKKVKSLHNFAVIASVSFPRHAYRQAGKRESKWALTNIKQIPIFMGMTQGARNNRTTLYEKSKNTKCTI